MYLVIVALGCEPMENLLRISEARRATIHCKLRLAHRNFDTMLLSIVAPCSVMLPCRFSQVYINPGRVPSNLVRQHEHLECGYARESPGVWQLTLKM